MEADSFSPALQHAKRTEDGDAYQFAVNYRPFKSARLYAKYDHAYRYPATDEVAYYQGSPGGIGPSSNIFFNESLKPETSDNFEFGADYSKGFLSLGGAAYHMVTTDEIAFHRYSSSPFRGLNENLAKTERNGVQAHVVYDRCWVGFRARADVVDAQIKEDPINNNVGRVPMVPRWQTTETVFSRPLTGLMVELTHRYLGESTASPSSSGIMPAAGFFDTKISYDVTPRWSVYSGVNNIADKKSMAANFFGGIYPNEGRFIYLGSTYKF
jgi:outer membrane receptor protein involved in Fe transport